MKRKIKSRPTKHKDLIGISYLYNCDTGRHSINISALLKWFISQIVECKILSIQVSSLIFLGSHSWRMGHRWFQQPILDRKPKATRHRDRQLTNAVRAIKACDEFARSIYLCKRWAHISHKFVQPWHSVLGLGMVMPCWLLPLSGSSISHSKGLFTKRVYQLQGHDFAAKR